MLCVFSRRGTVKRILHKVWIACRFPWDWIVFTLEVFFCKERRFPVILCIANPGFLGGTELQVQIISEALKNRFGSCLVFVSGRVEGGRSNLFLKRLRDLAIPYLRLGVVGLVAYDRHPFLQKMLAIVLGKVVQGARICHFFNPSATVLSAVLKRLGLDLYYMETGMPEPGRWWDVLRMTMGHFRYVTSVSEVGLRRLERFYGYTGPSCTIPSMFLPPSRPWLCRKPMPGVFDVVYFGRMTPGKGVELLIQAFAHLVQEVPYANLLLIGSGEAICSFQEQVRALHLADRVRFTNWLQNDDLFARLVVTDVFCLPSFSEGMPTSILEAMSIGLPIVATEVGGVPEIIEHNISGVLVPPRSEKALARALIDLAQDPLRRVQLSQEALQRWQKVGTQEVILRRLMQIYCAK